MPIKSSKELKLGFIGAGIVGSALAVRLHDRGYIIAAVSSKSYNTAQKLAASLPGCRSYSDNQHVADNSDLVFIATPDGVIPVVAARVKWHVGQGVVHCSGADSTAVLEPARSAGAQVGGFHPLQTFAGVQKAIENLPGSTFALEAEEPLLSILQDITLSLEGHSVILSAADKAAYHTAAVIACNYMVTLVKMASDLWQTFGVSREQATRALLPLMKGTLNNIENIGLPNCLTGPIARGDTGTIKKHLATLEKLTPGLVSTYCELGTQTVPIALAKGKIDNKAAAELKQILTPNRINL